MGQMFGCEGCKRDDGYRYPSELLPLPQEPTNFVIDLNIVQNDTFTILDTQGRIRAFIEIEGGITKERNYWFTEDCHYRLRNFTNENGNIEKGEVLYSALVRRTYTTFLGFMDVKKNPCDETGQSRWDWQDMFTAEFYLPVKERKTTYTKNDDDDEELEAKTEEVTKEEMMTLLKVEINGSTVRTKKVETNPDSRDSVTSLPQNSKQTENKYTMSMADGTDMNVQYGQGNHSPALAFRYNCGFFEMGEVKNNKIFLRAHPTDTTKPVLATLVAFVLYHLSPGMISSIRTCQYMYESPTMIQHRRSENEKKQVTSATSETLAAQHFSNY